jgi:three-Cys-motif partner protein
MVIQDVPWHAEPHTKAKHALYRQYLGKWMPIMVQHWSEGNFTYAEGYAGPGVYTDKSPGSPVIAFQSLIKDEAIRKKFLASGAKNIRLLFVDKNPRCIEILKGEIAAAAHPVSVLDLPENGIVVDFETGKCDPALANLLTKHQAWDRPMLVVLDTWESAPGLDLVRRVAQSSSGEVIITIKPQWFIRFVTSPKSDHADRVFDGPAWREVETKSPEEKARWLLEHYRDRVRQSGFSYVLDFELMTVAREALYLVFGTNHKQGLVKMKEAMWEVDATNGVGYRDPRDKQQQTLEIALEPQTAPLKRLLVQYLESQSDGSAKVQELRKFTLFSTIYKESQVMPLVEKMLEGGELLNDDGGRRGDANRVVRIR